MKAEEDKNNVSADDSKDGEGKGEKSEGAAAEGGPVTETGEPAEEDVPTFTLDEYKAREARKNQPKFNLRKAGEGSDLDPKWKKTTMYKKERETHDDEDEEVIEKNSGRRTNEIYMMKNDRDI
jgi:hypothetical protein